PVVVTNREAFPRRLLDAGDRKAHFLDRLNARTGKGRRRRVVRVPIGPDFAETGKNRRGRLPLRRRGERAKLRRRQGNRGDSFLAYPRRVSIPERKPFRRTAFASSDDGTHFLDRLDAWSDKRRKRRILRVPVAAELAQTGEHRGRSLSLSRRDKFPKLRWIDRLDRAADRRPGRRVRGELVFDVLFDLAPVGDVFLMLIQCFGERMPSRSVGDKIEVLTPCRFRDRFQRRLARVANRPRRQAVNDVRVIGRRLIEVRPRYA